jgi:hypothetical protein
VADLVEVAPVVAVWVVHAVRLPGGTRAGNGGAETSRAPTGCVSVIDMVRALASVGQWTDSVARETPGMQGGFAGWLL